MAILQNKSTLKTCCKSRLNTSSCLSVYLKKLIIILAITLFYIPTELKAQLPTAGKEFTTEEAISFALEHNNYFNYARLTSQSGWLNYASEEESSPYTFNLGARYSHDESLSATSVEQGVSIANTMGFETSLTKHFPLGTDVSLSLNNTWGSYTHPYSTTDSDDITTIGPIWTNSLQLTLNQPLLRGAGRDVNMLNIDLARQEAHMSDWQRTALLSLLVRNVLMAYWELVYANGELKARKSTLELLESERNATYTLIEQGAVAGIQIVFVDQRITAQKSAIKLAELNQIQAERQFRAVLGFPLDGKNVPRLIPTDIVSPTQSVINADKIVEVALRRAPELNLIKHEINQQRLIVEASKDAVSPQLNLEAGGALMGISESYGTTYSQIVTGQIPSFFIGLLFSMPLDNSQATKRHERNLVVLEQLELRLEESNRLLTTQVRDTCDTIKIYWELIELSKEYFQLSQRTLEAERARYELGVSSSLFPIFTLTDEYEMSHLSMMRGEINYIESIIMLQYLTNTLLWEYGVDEHEG